MVDNSNTSTQDSDATKAPSSSEPTAAAAAPEKAPVTPEPKVGMTPAQIEALVQERVSASSKQTAEEVRREFQQKMLSALGHEAGKKKPELDAFQEAFARDGKTFTQAVIEEAKTQVREDLATQQATKVKMEKLLAPHLEEYPLLKNNIDVIALEAQRLGLTGEQDPEGDLAKAVESTAKRLQLVKESEKSKNQDVTHGFLPPVEGNRASSVIMQRRQDNADATSAYIKQLRENHARVTQRKPIMSSKTN